MFAPLLAGFALQGVVGPFEAVVFLFAIVLGIAAPDADAGDRLSRPKLGYASGRPPLAVVLELARKWLSWGFMAVSKYFFLAPLLAFLKLAGYRDIAKHRGVMHSLFAALLCVAFWELLMLAASALLGAGPGFALFFGSGLLFGFVFHLYADSLTPTGVNWLFPRKFLLRGRIRTQGPLYGKGVKLLDSQLFALAIFVFIGIILTWMLLSTSASAYFLAFLAAFCLLIASLAMGLELDVDDYKFGRPSLRDFEFE